MDKEDLLKKWLNDTLSDAEKEAFLQSDEYVFYEDIINSAHHFKAANFSNPDDFETFKAKYKYQDRKVKQLKWFNPLVRIASMVIIALGLYLVFFNNSQINIKTLANQQKTIELPDASKVVLNAKSQITFNKSDWNKHRKVQLDGEAYFKVHKGNVFDVITTDGKVTVVGTQFNVKQRKDYFEVICFEGVVKVTSQSISKTLYANDTYRILNGAFSGRKTTYLLPQWTNNKSSFESVPFKEVIAELERQYDIEIVLKQVDEYRIFTGGFVHGNMKNALMSVTQPMDLTYEIITANQVVIHGN